MRLCRREDGAILRESEGVWSRVPVGSMAELLRLPRTELQALLSTELPTAEQGRLTAPVDGRTEIWASGVTYLRSRAARMEEATVPDVYDRVYDADRPELFFKSVAWRVSTDGDPVGIREDSGWDVPEPELAAVVNAFGEIVAYSICNDMSSRSIEGENPLYLPQAKVYAGACAVGMFLRPAWEVDHGDLTIQLSIERDGRVVFADQTSTDQLARPVDTLVSYLFRGEVFPDGVWLSTGTGIVPPEEFSLQSGDVVDIEIGGLGRLRNPVVRGLAHWGEGRSR